MKNACPDRQSYLVALLYGEISEEDRRRTGAHLDVCPGCRAAYEQMVETRGLLAAWPPPRSAGVPALHPHGTALPPPWRDRYPKGAGRWLPPRAGRIAAAALLVAAVAAFFTLLELRPGPDGALRPALALGNPRSVPLTTGARDESDRPLTRAAFEQGLAELLFYLDDRALQERRRQHQTLLALLEEHLAERDQVLAAHLGEQIVHSFNRLEEQRHHDLQMVAAALENLEYIAATELQRTNTILAALLGERTGLPRE